jgi:hypothetical protein
MSHDFSTLQQYLALIPATSWVASGTFENGNWWVKFDINITHPLAWNVVQEFGDVLNYVSVSERLSSVFMPVSPPPYLKGGPRNSSRG